VTVRLAGWQASTIRPNSLAAEAEDGDQKLCKLLVDYEEQSEIIGVMDFVREYKIEATLSDGRLPAGSKR
jgi:hypothetical protein